MTNKPIWNKSSAIVIGGYSGLWQHVYGERYSMIDSQNVRRGLGKTLDGAGRFAYNQVIKAFIVGDIGTVATAPNYYVKAQDPAEPMTLGGYRPSVQYMAINRAVTLADQVAITQDLAYHNSPTWVVDKAGNGGGGRFL